MQAARGAPLNHSGGSAREPLNRSGRFHLGLFATIAILAFGLDVVSKLIAVEALSGRAPVQVGGQYFQLDVAYNPGAAFSLGTSYTEVLTGIAICAAIVVLWVARRLSSTGWAIGLGFLLGGVLGNLSDRVFRSPGPLRGHVIDFLMFPHFPVFNVADIWINIAAATIIIQALRGVRVDGTRHEEADAPTEATGP